MDTLYDLLANYGTNLLSLAVGSAATYGVLRLRGSRRPTPGPAPAAEPATHVVGRLGGPDRACPYCRKPVETLLVFSNQHVSCPDCTQYVPGAKA